MMNDPRYDQISYNCFLSNAVKSKLGRNPTIFFVQMKRARGKKMAEHVIRLAKVIPTSCVKAWHAQMLLIIHRLWKDLKIVEERRERWMVGKRMILALMYVLMERIESIVLHPYIFVPMVACL